MALNIYPCYIISVLLFLFREPHFDNKRADRLCRVALNNLQGLAERWLYLRQCQRSFFCCWRLAIADAVACRCLLQRPLASFDSTALELRSRRAPSCHRHLRRLSAPLRLHSSPVTTVSAAAAPASLSARATLAWPACPTQDARLLVPEEDSGRQRVLVENELTHAPKEKEGPRIFIQSPRQEDGEGVATAVDATGDQQRKVVSVRAENNIHNHDLPGGIA